MIIMAVLAPVLIMGMILMGAATIALAVMSVAAVGGIVVGVSDSAFHAVTRRRAARKREIPDNVVAWPRPTAQPGFADSQAWNTEQVVGFEPWEEVLPFDEPDFEKVFTYTLVAGTDF